MKKIDLGQALQLLGNADVILGILFIVETAVKILPGQSIFGAAG